MKHHMMEHNHYLKQLYAIPIRGLKEAALDHNIIINTTGPLSIRDHFLAGNSIHRIEPSTKPEEGKFYLLTTTSKKHAAWEIFDSIRQAYEDNTIPDDLILDDCPIIRHGDLHRQAAIYKTTTYTDYVRFFT